MIDRLRIIEWRRWPPAGTIWLASFLTLAILVTQTASTPTPPAPPLNSLIISKPGDTSQVTSPIPVEAEIEVGQRGALHLELVGEDGRVIARKVFTFRECDLDRSGQENRTFVLREPASFCGGRRMHLSTNLIFGITEGSQSARLQLSIFDGSQRILIQNSVGITLRVDGTAKILSAASGEQGISITEPKEDVTISGQTLVITGEAPVTHILPMRVEVVTIAGKMLGSRMVSVVQDGGRDGDPQRGVFEVAMPLKIKAPQPALITISAPDENISGERYIASRRVTLLP